MVPLIIVLLSIVLWLMVLLSILDIEHLRKWVGIMVGVMLIEYWCSCRNLHNVDFIFFAHPLSSTI